MSSDPPETPRELRGTAAKGFAWTGAQTLVIRVLSLVSFVVLARLLTPEEYGIVALANVFNGLFALLAAAGYSQALVQRPSIDKEDLDTVFWIGMASSLVLTLILFVSAWPLAAAFDEPQLRPVIQVLSISLIFIALGATHQAVLQRRLDWRGLTIRTVVANLVATVAGVTFAILGFGVWALVVQSVLSSIVGSVALMLQSGYRPSLQVSRTRFNALFSFSRNYLGNSLLIYASFRADDFLIGAVLGPIALGVYSVGYRVLSIMNEALASTIRTVAFPVLSRIQHDKPRLLRAYVSANRMSSVVSLPVYGITFAMAPEIVHVVFGSKWDASVPVMQILCWFGVIQAITAFNYALLTAVGRIKLVFRLTVLNTVLQIAAFAVTVQYGIEWVAAAYVIRAYLVAPIGFFVAARILDAKVRVTVSGFVPALVSASAMLAVVYAGRALTEDLPDLARLVLLIPVGLAVFAAVLRLTARPLFDELAAYVRRAVTRGPKTPAAST